MRFIYKKRMFFIGTFVLGIYLFICYLPANTFRGFQGWMKKGKAKPNYYTYKPDIFLDMPRVFFHLDFKGAPPDLVFLMSTLSDLQEIGVNGLLIEYEDMFPYEGRLANLSSSSAYEKDELVEFLVKMANLSLEIVPLIQTFGHLEYALKLPEFKHLRENELYPDSICPSHPATEEFLREMIGQVIEFHKDITPLKYFHIGCDEVYHVKKCNLCANSSLSPVELYLKHIKNVIEIVKNLSPDTTVLYWHDIILKSDPILLDNLNLNAEPVAWAYQPDVGMADINFFRYPHDIRNVWIASAYKGADGRTSVLPNITNRMENNFNILKTILEFGQLFRGYSNSRSFDFQGLILTGWSRYSHMSPICDLYSVSHSSAIACLLVIKEFKHGVAWSELSNGFNTFYENRLRDSIIQYFECNIILPEEEKLCTLPDWQRLSFFIRYYATIKEKIVHFYSSTENDLDSLDFYFDLGIVDLNSLNVYYFTCQDFLKTIASVEISVIKYMQFIYDNATIEEYVNFLTYYLKTKLTNTIHTIENYTQVRCWKRRTVEHYYTRKHVNFYLNGSRT